jgi:sarcosine oxidase subunit beta
MRDAYALWPTLHETLNVPQFYERTGHLLLAESDEDVARAEAHAAAQNALGIKTEMLYGEALREREPHLAQAVQAAAYCPLDGVADHTATTLAYLAAARLHGVNVRTHCEVASFEVGRSRANALVTTRGERIEATRGIILLTNSTVAPLLRPLRELPVWSACFQVLVTDAMDDVPFTHLIGHVSRTVSLKREGKHQVMISGGWRGQWDPAIREGSALSASIDANVREAINVLPALDGLVVATADASHQESVTTDSVPIIDTLPGADNLLFATGWCGHGWAIAPVIADALGAWALTGERPMPLAPFSLARFGT